MTNFNIDIHKAGTFILGEKSINRMGYGAMQLTGPHVFGPPKDRNAAVSVLKKVISRGVNHIDTSDFYGPHIVNEIIREALHPYPDNLLIVTKVGVKRDNKGGWLPAQSAEDITKAIHDNLRNLGLQSLDVVNLRVMIDPTKPTEGPITPQIKTLVKLREEGLIKHIGLSNVTTRQVHEAQQYTAISCIQNHYNLIHREDDDLIDELNNNHIAYVPFFPLGGFSPIQSDSLTKIAKQINATAHQVALAWLLQRSPNILLIPGTSSLSHLEDNLAAASLELDKETLAQLNTLATQA
ncbi:oxidoreductase [Entomobacter blattae]|uniref:Pyridoxine 4-dehydrogenase n=1 Tax=Entomobacter blattae TaxID=2762277 RepID=A0A7H1NRB9_9PROT|nr:oxidoreductase [Entomobacter blattae]QNT78329.1 Pyridoxine 4-dehydrogenase [Entomobacter blattae]